MTVEAFPSPGPEAIALEEKATVITGGTTGIGRAIAELLISRGARVLIFGRHERELREALQSLQSRGGGESHGLIADVSRHEDVRRVFDEADRRMGGVDVLINNAAVSGGQFLDGSFEDWRYALETNLLGYIACAREAVERMKRKGDGHIVNVGSMSADLREPDSVYASTKAGVQAFTESLRKSVNPLGIRVSLIEPGSVATPLQDKPPQEQQRKIEAMESLKAGDIAECVYFCLTQPKRCDVVMMQVRPLKQII